MTQFKIGDKAILTKDVDTLPKGTTVTVYSFRSNLEGYDFTVSIDDPILSKSYGHFLCTINGVETPCGYYVPRSSIEHICTELQYDPNQQPDQEDDL